MNSYEKMARTLDESGQLGVAPSQEIDPLARHYGFSLTWCPSFSCPLVSGMCRHCHGA